MIKDVVDNGAPGEVRIARLWWVVSAVGALLLVILLAAVIFYRESDKPFGFEVAWMGEMVKLRAPVWTIPALAFDWVGGGIRSIVYVPLTIIGGLLIWRRPWGALYYATAALTSVTLTTIIKDLVGRPRPTEILVAPDFGSFPSGHSANAALIAMTLGIIFRRIWIWITGTVYTLLMMLSRTYLGAHWISDTVGGMLVGAGVAIIIWAPFAFRLYRERRLPHPPIWRTVRVVTFERNEKTATATVAKTGGLRRWHEKFVVQERYLPSSARRALYLWAIVLSAVGVVAFSIILFDVLSHDGLARIDVPIQHWLDSHRTPALTAVTIVVATVFGPIALPIIVFVVTAVWAVVAKHLWRPLLLAGGTITGVIVVQVIAHLVNRHRPPVAQMLIGTDNTASFPSGHVLGACDFLLILTYLIVSRSTDRRAAYVLFLISAILILATAFSRVYLGYHWPTDALASISLSLVIVAAVIAVDTKRTVRVRPADGIWPADALTGTSKV